LAEGSDGSWQRVEGLVGRGLSGQLAEGRGLSWQRAQLAVGRGFRWQLAEGLVGIWQTVECWLFGLVGFLVSSWPEQFSRAANNRYIRVVGWTLGQFLAGAVLQGNQEHIYKSGWLDSWSVLSQNSSPGQPITDISEWLAGLLVSSWPE